MKKFTILFTLFFAMIMNTNAQIPNNGFENWITVGNYESPTGWINCNANANGSFFPVTKSSDHFPPSVGNYSIKLENQIPLTDCYSYGFAHTSPIIDNACIPSFPITGHPNFFCGYYKFFPQNNDTMQIALELFKNGVLITGLNFITTNTVSNWTSFNIPIPSYSSADSATINLAAFYNDSTCQYPYGPFGNSILYVDNISFDNIISSISEQRFRNITFSIYPNPASDIIILNIDNPNNAVLTLNIYNIIGQLIKSEILEQKSEQLNISNLSKGIYILEIKSNEMSEKQKLIIQRL